MSFFQLHHGQLNLPKQQTKIDLTPESDSRSASTWKLYNYAKFPWPSSSIKRIEQYIDAHPILSGLSGDALPLTDRPLSTQRSMSRMSGQIVGECRTMLNSTSWLSTDEVQFLLAFLMRNHDHDCFCVQYTRHALGICCGG
jgi:hypothetical protein